MTYLELINDVLIRLRETTVSTNAETTYSTLIGKFVNDAKRKAAAEEATKTRLEKLKEENNAIIKFVEDLNLTLYEMRLDDQAAQEQAVIDGMRREGQARASAAANLNKLLQLSGGAVYSDSGEVIAFDASNRITALKEVIDEASHKVIVFVPYRHAIQIVYEELIKDGYTAEVISGAVSVNNRTDIFNRFQTEPDPKVLVIQPQAASHGVTLHAANVVVYWSPVMSVETYLQANARVHRAGQRNPCTVVHLQGSHVEKRMYAMLEAKVDIHTRVVDLYKNLLEDD